MSSEPWYKDGLRFQCTRCGSCCSGFSGTVRVNGEEIAALSRHLGLPEAEFRKTYTRHLVGGGVSLIEKQNTDCIFFNKEHGCMVYEDRPRQCRTWPFWRAIVYSPRRWAEATKRCIGMNRGSVYTSDIITQMIEHDGTSSTLLEMKDRFYQRSKKGCS